MSDPLQPPVPPRPEPHTAAPHLPAEPQHPAAQTPPAQAPQYPAQYPPQAPQYPQQAAQYPPQAPAGAPASSTAPPAYAPAQPGYPYAPAAPAASRPGNALGRTAFLVAAITFGINLLVTVMTPFAYVASNAFEIVTAVGGVVGALSFLAYAAALVMGFLSIRRPGPHLFTGIAIGIAGVGVLGIAFGWMASLFYRFY